MFLPETPITCPVKRDTKCEGTAVSSTFTVCGLLLFYLLMSVCCCFTCTLLFYIVSHGLSIFDGNHIALWVVFFLIVLTWLKIQFSGIQCSSRQTNVIRPHLHLLSHVDNVPYY